jgi:hypothetical protein
MQANSFGLVTDTAGAATPLTTDTTIRCCKIRFRARNANTGLVNVGIVGFTPGGAGMIGEVLKPSSGYSDQIDIDSSDGGNLLYPADYAVKPAVNGEGVYVSYWIR